MDLGAVARVGLNHINKKGGLYLQVAYLDWRGFYWHGLRNIKMKKQFLLGTGLLASALLVGCGGSSGGSGAENFSVDGLAAVEGSTSIAGIWVGATAYVETESGSFTNESGDTIPYTDTYTGSRMVTYMINGNDAEGYTFTDCDSNNPTVDYEPSTATVTVDGRELQMSNFNQMSGTSTEAEWGSEGQENWSWIKVSNSTDNIGSFIVNLSSPDIAQSNDIGTDLLALCRESYVFDSTWGDGWTTQYNKGAYAEEGGSDDWFYVREDSDGFKSAYFGLLNRSVNSDTGSVSMSVQNSSATEYKATYTGSEEGATVTGTLQVSIPVQ